MNNPIFQELPDEDKYFSVKNDDRMYSDLRATSGYVKQAEKRERNYSKINPHILLKAAATKKLRVRIWAYSRAEYMYILTKSGLTLRHRTFVINQSDDDFLEYEGKTIWEKRCLVYWGKKRKQKGGAIPIGLLASIGAPIL